MKQVIERWIRKGTSSFSNDRAPAELLITGAGKLARIHGYERQLTFDNEFESIYAYLRIINNPMFTNVTRGKIDTPFIVTDEHDNIQQKYVVTFEDALNRNTTRAYPELLNACVNTSQIIAIDTIVEIGNDNVYSARVDGLVCDRAAVLKAVGEKRIKHIQDKTNYPIEDLYASFKFEAYDFKNKQLNPYKSNLEQDTNNSLDQIKWGQYQKHTNIYLTGPGGAGKSYLINKMIPAHQQLSIFTPTNKLAQELNEKSNSAVAMTYHSGANSAMEFNPKYKKFASGNKHSKLAHEGKTFHVLEECDSTNSSQLTTYMKNYPYSRNICVGDQIQIAPQCGKGFADQLYTEHPEYGVMFYSPRFTNEFVDMCDWRYDLDNKESIQFQVMRLEGSYRFINEETKSFHSFVRDFTEIQGDKTPDQLIQKIENSKKQKCKNVEKSIEKDFPNPFPIQVFKENTTGIPQKFKNWAISAEATTKIKDLQRCDRQMNTLACDLFRLIKEKYPTVAFSSMRTLVEETLPKYMLSKQKFFMTSKTTSDSQKRGRAVVINMFVKDLSKRFIKNKQAHLVPCQTGANSIQINSELTIKKKTMLFLHISTEGKYRGELTDGTMFDISENQKKHFIPSACFSQNTFQGSTIPTNTKFIVDLRRSKNPSDLYVAFSRMRLLSQLVVIECLNDDAAIRDQLRFGFQTDDVTTQKLIFGCTRAELTAILDEKMLKRYGRILKDNERTLDHIFPVSLSSLQTKPNHHTNIEYLLRCENASKKDFIDIDELKIPINE